MITPIHSATALNLLAGKAIMFFYLSFIPEKAKI